MDSVVSVRIPWYKFLCSVGSSVKADTCSRLVFCIGFHEYRSASRCSKLDVDRKWLADAKFQHSPSGTTEQKERSDVEKDDGTRTNFLRANGARIAYPFNRKLSHWSYLKIACYVSKESVSIDIAISVDTKRYLTFTDICRNVQTRFSNEISRIYRIY